MLSYLASLLSISTGAIADFVRNSQTGVLVGLGSVCLIFGTLLRRHWPIDEDQTPSQMSVVWRRTPQLTGHAGVSVPASNLMGLQTDVANSYPSRVWEPTIPLNSYIATLDRNRSTTTNRSGLDAV